MPRLPSSLNWLIDKRARVDGELQRAEKYLLKNQRVFEKYLRMQQEVPVLRNILDSLDQILGLHEVQINPQLIPTIRGKVRKHELPHGEITKSIFRRLQMADGQPVSSNEIAEYLAQRRQDFGLPPAPSKQLLRQIHQRLGCLYAEGKLERHHQLPANTYGLWSISPRFIQGIQNQGDVLEHTP